MFPTHYVANRDSDQPVDKETFAGSDLKTAIETARQWVRNMNVALHGTGRTLPVGFLIFDSSGANLLHREYLG